MKIAILNTDNNIIGEIKPIAGLKTSEGSIAKVNPKSLFINHVKVGGFSCRKDSATWPTVNYSDLSDSQLDIAIINTSTSNEDELIRSITQKNKTPSQLVNILLKVAKAAQSTSSDVSQTYKDNSIQNGLSQEAKIAAACAILSA